MQIGFLICFFKHPLQRVYVYAYIANSASRSELHTQSATTARLLANRSLEFFYV